MSANRHAAEALHFCVVAAHVADRKPHHLDREQARALMPAMGRAVEVLLFLGFPPDPACVCGYCTLPGGFRGRARPHELLDVSELVLRRAAPEAGE